MVDAEITSVAIEPLLAAMTADAALSARWVCMHNAELRRLRLQCERLALNRVQDRLLHLIETEGQGGRVSRGAGLKPLAGQLGVTHEALCRCVANLEKAQVSRREGAALVLTQGDEVCGKFI